MKENKIFYGWWIVLGCVLIACTVVPLVMALSNQYLLQVTKEMNIMEAVEKYPIIAQVLMRYGLGCVGCIISTAETLGEGIAAHGLNPDIIIEEVNMILDKQEA